MTTAANPLMAAIESFDAAEANLIKLERLWAEMEELIPVGVSFGPNPEYETRARAFGPILAALPKIDGWKPQTEPPDLDALAENRFDAMELGEPGIEAHVDREAYAPGQELRAYRFRLNSKRRALVRDSLIGLIDAIDTDLALLREQSGPPAQAVRLDEAAWAPLRQHIKQIELLLGASVAPPPGWSNLHRHAWFAHQQDLADIESRDWPQVREGLRASLYGPDEPIPVGVEDLGDIVAARPLGAIVTALDWSKLTPEDFERLIFSLINRSDGYENPEWMMKTNAPDQGRDLSVTRVIGDALAQTMRLRTIIQCKHWLSRSVDLGEVSMTASQMALWDKPPVELLIVATSGRFTADALRWAETHNAKGERPRVELWPESHLERLLVERPYLIAEFNLR